MRRQLLIATTILMISMPVLSIGASIALLPQWPRLGLWSQILLGIWFSTSLWEGKSWTRLACAIYYSLSFIAVLIVLILSWAKLPIEFQVVFIVILAIAFTLASLFWFSSALSAPQQRRAGTED